MTQTACRPDADARMLSASAERELIERWRDLGDGAAGNRLIRSFAPLVRKHAERFRKYGVPVDDLVQEGNLALIEAAQRFDTERGVRFASYAIWWLKARLQDYVLRNRSIVRLGKTRQEKSLFFKLGHLQVAASQKQGTGASANQSIASALGLKLSQVERMDIRLRQGDVYLDAPLARSEEDVGRFLPDSRPSPETVAAESETRDVASRSLSAALDRLTRRERRIITARRLSEERTTLRELGQELGVSTERVRQIENEALTKLRQSLTKVLEAPCDLFTGSPQPSVGVLSGH